MPLLRLFGHPVLERDGTRSAIKVPAKAVALLAIVVANHLRPLSREWLAQSLWPDADASEARANLRRHLHLLRAIDEDVLTLTRTTVQWNGECLTDVDVIRFDAFAQQQPALAIQEYSGELCAGIADESLDSLRLRYQSAYEAILRRLIETAKAAHDDSQLSVWLQRALNHDPFDEAAVRQIMELRMRNGDRTGAIREFNALAQRLRTDLATEPEPQTIAVFHEIAGAVDEARTPNNLPNPSTTFVGREHDLSRLTDAARDSRIITLVGAGGIGKTRLALRAARLLLPSYTAGAWFVALDHARNEAAIWQLIADALSLPASPAPRKTVLHALERSKALLIFDTCEHATESVRSVAEALVEVTPVTVIATSRRKLHAMGEVPMDILPLELPPADSSNMPAVRFPAYRLFVERATTVNPAFRIEPRDARALSDILCRTDGLPLAIELVASRANVLTLEGMRKRLPDAMRGTHRSPANTRAQTIDATIAWSYELLSQKHQEVFLRLCTFESTFDIEDAEQLFADADDVALAVFELVDASLVSVSAEAGSVRYRLLDTTKTFGRRILSESKDGSAASLSHAHLFARKARAIADTTDDRFGVLLRPTLAAMPDYFAALEYAGAHDRLDLAMAILEGIHRFGVRQHFTFEMLERAQALLSKFDGATSEQRARLVRITSILAQNCDRYDLALSLTQTAVQLYEQLGDEAGACDAVSAQAASLYYLERHEESEKLLVQVCERARRAGLTRIYLKSAGRLGALIDDYDRAVRLLVPASEEMLQLGETRQAAFAFRNIAANAFFQNRWTEAAQWASKAVALFDESGDPALRALLLTTRGCALQEAGDTAAAVRSHLEALPLCASFEEHIEAVECLEDIAVTLANSGDSIGAARLVGYAVRARTRLGIPLTAQQNRYYGPVRERLAQTLGLNYEVERAAGAQLSASQIAHLAGERLAGLVPLEEAG